MYNKSLIMIGALVGSTAGAYLPSLWGAGVFTFSSVVASLVGGILGMWLGVKASQYI